MNYCFAFDLGKVLFDFDYNIALKKISSKIKVAPREIINELFINNFAEDFEKGIISSRKFYEKFRRRFGFCGSYKEFSDTWCNIFSLNKDMAGLVKQVGRSYPVYLISNINKLHFNYLRHKFPAIFSVFDGLILSYKVKSLKPEEKIYSQLKEKCGYNYEKIIYIDDRGDLIKEAKHLNLKCIQFTGYAGLKSTLQAMGIIIPAPKNTNHRKGRRLPESGKN